MDGKLVGQAAAVLCSLALALLLFDLAAYWLAPDPWVRFATGYRIASTNGVALGVNVLDPELGHDMKADLPPTEVLPGVVRFSNDIACGDPHRLAVFRTPHPYDYFAGDSLTYRPFLQSYPFVYEQLTGRRSAKCGLDATGTRHQFEKFRRSLQKIGHPPRRVFVGHYRNDLADDHRFPLPSPQALGPLQTAFRQYSLASHLLNALLRRLGYFAPPAGPPSYSEEPYPAFGASAATLPTRLAMEEWLAHARQHGYRLIFLLLPDVLIYGRPEYYAELRLWLDRQGAEYLDLGRPMATLPRQEVEAWYGGGDPIHPGPEAHRFWGRLVAERYP